MKCIPRLFLLAALLTVAGGAYAKGPDLPKAASPSEIAQLMAKPPAGLEIVDIRPAAEFSDYALPGSLNLDPSAILADESLLSGTGPLLLVDKDGTRAFALAGALVQRGSRQIVVLTGGLIAWWTAQELGLAVRETPLADTPGGPAQTPVKSPGEAPRAPGPVPPGSPNTPGAPTAPQPPASKGAGC